MDIGVILTLVAGVGWATNIVVVRWALDRTETPPLAGAFVGVAVASLVTLLVAVAVGASHPDGGDLWRFALVGVIAPGSSQGLFVSSIRSIGPARSSVLVSTNPIWSILLAVLFLGESPRLILLVGAGLVVLGGILTSWEPGLGFRHVGVVLALIVAVSFGIRDVVARQFTSGSHLSVWWSAAVVLAAASATVGVIGLVQHGPGFRADVGRAAPAFVWSGLVIAGALTALLAALGRTTVGVVAPLTNAAQSVTVVALGAVVVGKTERTPRILAALVLVVLGGALITST